MFTFMYHNLMFYRRITGSQTSIDFEFKLT